MSKDRETTTEAHPWGPSIGPLRQVGAAATDLYFGPDSKIADTYRREQRLFEPEGMGSIMPDPYAGPRVAPFSAQTETALTDLGQGSGLGEMGIGAISDILDADNRGVIRDIVADDVKAQLGSTFTGGSVNSSLAQDAYARAMTEALAKAEYGARLDALSRMPSISGMIGSEEKAALGAGLTRDDLAQRQIDADMERYYETEDQDYNALKRYASIASGIGGMGATTTSTQKGNFMDTLSGIGKLASGIGGFGTGMADFWSAV